MSDTVSARNVRLSYFLPSGFLSHDAIEMSLADSAYSSLEYSPDMSIDTRLYYSESAQGSRNKTLYRMEKYGYIKSYEVKYGPQRWQKVRIFKLTRHGLYFLTNTCDTDLERKRIVTYQETYNTNSEPTCYSSQSDKSKTLRARLNDLAKTKDTDPVAASEFEAALLTGINSDELTILASEPYKANFVNLALSKYGFDFYREYRNSNIRAMFRANNYLTCIDRRPLDPYLNKKHLYETTGANNVDPNDRTTSEALGPITEEKPKTEPTEKEENGNSLIDPTLSIDAFSRETISQWYEKHADSLRFIKPTQSTERERKLWENTPAYYEANELPGLDPVIDLPDNMISAGSLTNTRRRTFNGIAVGKKVTYLVYHTRQKHTLWSKSIESNTVRDVENILYKLQAETGQESLSRKLCHAIMFCPSVYQFAELFVGTRKKITRKNSITRLVGLPYRTVSIVTMTSSGKAQLRCLLQSSPEEYDRIMAESLAAKYPDKFHQTKDPLFQLGYKKKPVLLAYSMNFQRLFSAWEKYLNGERFFIMCYPEQVKYLKKIMPENEYL